jgi:hypothetical protein
MQNLGNGTAFQTEQGDQIGRIFTFCAIVYLGQVSFNFLKSPKFWDTFSRVKGMYSHFDK